jgi:hypothetical protein
MLIPFHPGNFSSYYYICPEAILVNPIQMHCIDPTFSIQIIISQQKLLYKISIG